MKRINAENIDSTETKILLTSMTTYYFMVILLYKTNHNHYKNRPAEELSPAEARFGQSKGNHDFIFSSQNLGVNDL